MPKIRTCKAKDIQQRQTFTKGSLQASRSHPCANKHPSGSDPAYPRTV